VFLSGLMPCARRHRCILSWQASQNRPSLRGNEVSDKIVKLIRSKVTNEVIDKNTLNHRLSLPDLIGQSRHGKRSVDSPVKPENDIMTPSSELLSNVIVIEAVEERKRARNWK
jgi:hypothetical protein